ncbi:alpha-2-HS-glycoprotein 1 [Scomber scombrus]|uniref:alpha-2-HS-glycoprotein 1 n=1 Tax=Scomber scombrus TaxID=13677 RepID=UPI002DD7EE27|nr:alpha-2-HS-glycoprotein 1 [Scomber scombrus]
MSPTAVVCCGSLLYTMKHIVVLLLSSAVLLCSAAPALELVTCSEDSGAAAAHLAMHHINEHHDHGYKFRLSEIQDIKVVTVDGGCDVELQLKLLETKCHVVTPKHFEDCEIREEYERAVMANCTVMITVKSDDAKVTKYECDTRQAKTNLEMVRICPDCPSLIPLNSPEAMRSVDETVKQFNQNTSNQHYYILQEAGRVLSGYMMMAGMVYYPEVVLLETRCPMGSRIVPEACKPLCPDRAHHAVCRSSYSAKEGLGSVECEFYPPSNVTALSPGEREPVCMPPYHVGPPHPPGSGGPPHLGPPPHGPPPHAGHGPPPHAGHGPPPHPGHGPPPHAGHGPPPHAGHGPPPHPGHGPPPHAGGRGPLPGQKRPPFISHPPHHCRSFNLLRFEPALHPICPWPHPELHPHPKHT